MTPTANTKVIDLTLKAEKDLTDVVPDGVKATGAPAEKRLEDLVVYWDLWLRTVRRIQKKKRAGVSKRRYERTYSRILRLCERRSSENKEHTAAGEDQDSFRIEMTIRSIITPWVSLDSLQYADQKLLKKLVAECSQIDRILHPLRIRINRKIVNLFGILLGLGCLAVFILEYQAIVSFGRSYTAVSYRRFWLSVETMSTEHWLSAMTVLVVIFGAWMTKDMRRF